MHVIGTWWSRDSDNVLRPSLMGWSEKGSLERVMLLNGRNASWKVSGPPRCTGFNASGQFVPCPEGVVLPPRKTQCGPCAAMDTQDGCKRCDGTKCFEEERRETCMNTKYVVYAVMIGEKLKVGVSTERRHLTRWVEQGADYAAVIRRLTGGEQARQLENQIGLRPSFTKSINVSTKIATLVHPVSHERAREIIVAGLSGLENTHDVSIETIQDLSKYYCLDSIDTKPEIHDPVREGAVVGNIIGVKGSLMVVQVHKSLLVYDLKRLVGHQISFDESVLVFHQTGLMDFE